MLKSLSAPHADSLHLFPGKKPQKPPRPSLPKLVTETVVPTERKTEANTTASTTTEGQSDSKSDVKQLSQTDSTQTCSRSVTVHWDIPTKHLCAPTAPNKTSSSSSDSEPSQRPIPLPRIKSRKQTINEEVKDQILVKLSDNSDNIQSDPQEVSTNEYLKELLEVFSGENKCDIVNQSDEATQGEDPVGEMSTNHGQRNMWARIQAFEDQANNDDGNDAESAKPQLPPRKPSIKPPVAAKPPVAFKPQVNNLMNSYSQNISTTDVPQIPSTGPRPQPPKKPGGPSIKDELEALHSKTVVPNKISPVLTRANSIYEEETSSVPPTLPARPFKEPLKPNLNINNHNSASLFSENEYMNTLSGM